MDDLPLYVSLNSPQCGATAGLHKVVDRRPEIGDAVSARGASRRYLGRVVGVGRSRVTIVDRHGQTRRPLHCSVEGVLEAVPR